MVSSGDDATTQRGPPAELLPQVRNGFSDDSQATKRKEMLGKCNRATKLWVGEVRSDENGDAVARDIDMTTQRSDLKHHAGADDDVIVLGEVRTQNDASGVKFCVADEHSSSKNSEGTGKSHVATLHPHDKDGEASSANVSEVEEKATTPALTRKKRGRKQKWTRLERINSAIEEFLEKPDSSSTETASEILHRLLKVADVESDDVPDKLGNETEEIVLPSHVILPPSQVVDVVVEYEPDVHLSECRRLLFPNEEEEPKETWKRERPLDCNLFPAGSMTKLLMDLGHDLVQETVFQDVISAKYLSDRPDAVAAYIEVAGQVMASYEALHIKNTPYKLPELCCHACSFKTESKIVLEKHTLTLHYDGRKYQCCFCEEFYTNRNMIKQHYFDSHGLIVEDDMPSRFPCPCCDADFSVKRQYDRHLKFCTQQYDQRRLLAPRYPDDVSAVNLWLWERRCGDIVSNLENACAIEEAEMSRSRIEAAMNSTLLSHTTLNAASTGNYTTYRDYVIARLESSGILSRSTGASLRVLHNGNSDSAKNSPSRSNFTPGTLSGFIVCEICDLGVNPQQFVSHMHLVHRQTMVGDSSGCALQPPSLVCDRCQKKFWTYNGLERHLVMSHQIVSPGLLAKARSERDGGHCKFCGKHFAFHLLIHLANAHSMKFTSASITFRCHACNFIADDYHHLQAHCSTVHRKGELQANSTAGSPSASSKADGHASASTSGTFAVGDGPSDCPPPLAVCTQPESRATSKGSPSCTPNATPRSPASVVGSQLPTVKNNKVPQSCAVDARKQSGAAEQRTPSNSSAVRGRKRKKGGGTPQYGCSLREKEKINVDLRPPKHIVRNFETITIDD